MDTVPSRAPSEPGPPVYLDAVLTPHRSLPPRGFAVLMAVLGGASLVSGIAFVSAGAWPVVGFFGLDVALVYVALRVSYRRARQREIVRLTDRTLLVQRVSPRGATQDWRFEPSWVRVIHYEDDPGGLVTLASHGRAVAVGSFLPPAERRGLAASLRDALGRWRQALRASS